MGSYLSFGFPRFLRLLVALFFSVLSGFFRVPGSVLFRFWRALDRAHVGAGVSFWFQSDALRASWPLLMLRFVFFRGRPLAPFRASGRYFLVGLLAEPQAAFFWLFRLG